MKGFIYNVLLAAVVVAACTGCEKGNNNKPDTTISNDSTDAKTKEETETLI